MKTLASVVDEFRKHTLFSYSIYYWHNYIF